MDSQVLSQLRFEQKLKKLSKEKYIPQEQEVELIKSAKAGDKAAQQKLFAQYSGLFKLFCKNHLWLDDREALLQECFIGFLDILKEYDPAREIKLSTFISNIGKFVIYRRLDKFARERYGLSKTDYGKVLNIIKIEGELFGEFGCRPTREQLIAGINKHGIYKKQANREKILEIYYRVRSSPATITVNNDEEEIEHPELQKRARNQESLEDIVVDRICLSDSMRAVHEIFCTLDEWQQLALEIFSRQDRPAYSEIAEELRKQGINVKVSRLRQFHNRIRSGKHGNINKAIKKLLVKETGIEELYPDLIERWKEKIKNSEKEREK